MGGGGLRARWKGSSGSVDHHCQAKKHRFETQQQGTREPWEVSMEGGRELLEHSPEVSGLVEEGWEDGSFGAH